MDRRNLSSSNIKSVGYDAESQTLEIEFSSKAVYHYFDVPIQLFDALCSAESPGKFFETSIKRAGYRFKRLS